MVGAIVWSYGVLRGRGYCLGCRIVRDARSWFFLLICRIP